MNPFTEWYPKPQWSVTLNGVRVELYPHYHIGRTKADALVILGNSMCWMGDGLAKWVRDEAGQMVEDELRKQAPLPVNGVAVAGRGLLPVKNIVYVNVIDSLNFTTLQTVVNSLVVGIDKAKSMGAKSILIVDITDNLSCWSAIQSAEALKYAVVSSSQGLSCVKLACCGGKNGDSYRVVLKG